MHERFLSSGCYHTFRKAHLRISVKDFNEMENTMPPNTNTFGSRVTASDCLLPGRVSMVWRVPITHHASRITFYYRVQFPPRSPFIGDWAVYRHGEIALVIDHPPLVDVVALMRPKIPTTH